MKFAVFTDLHLGIKQDDSSWHEVALNWCDSMVKTLKEKNVKDIIFLGDFFHNRNTICVDTLNVTSKFLKKLTDFNLHMILGNHDLYYKKEYTTSAVNIFDGFPNIKIYQKPEYITVGNKKLLFCGWGYDLMEYKSDILFTHAEISTFKFNETQTCEDGYLCSDLLKNHRLIYTGHFHLRQTKKYKLGEIRYVGNPFQMDFSDENDKKGFDILDTETGEREFIENKISPRFVRMKLSKMIQKDPEEMLPIIRNSYFKLIIDRNINTEDLNELLSLINGCRPRSSAHEYLNKQAFVKDENGEVEMISFQIEDAIQEYITNVLNIPEKREILKYSIDLYKRALR